MQTIEHKTTQSSKMLINERRKSHQKDAEVTLHQHLLQFHGKVDRLMSHIADENPTINTNTNKFISGTKPIHKQASVIRKNRLNMNIVIIKVH